MKIQRVRVRVIGPDVTRYHWAEAMPEQYMTGTLVTIETDEGVEGNGLASTYAPFDFDRSCAESIRRMIPALRGADPLNREGLWRSLRAASLPTIPGAQSAVDIALWDLAAKVAGLPLHRFLGGYRSRILAYASTPTFPTVEEYLDRTQAWIDEGYRAVKFHAYGVLDHDIALVEAVRKRFPRRDVAFMFDPENHYTRREGLTMARVLDDLGFAWFEAPLNDFDLTGYRELRAAVDIPILPAGNWVTDLSMLREYLSAGAWDVARADVATCGGITPARKIMALAESFDMSCELQCWGYTLSQAANLHLMLALPNCTYFEQPVPYASFEYGMIDVIRPDAEGYVTVPDAPGLGMRIDWDAMRAATILELP